MSGCIVRRQSDLRVEECRVFVERNSAYFDTNRERRGGGEAYVHFTHQASLSSSPFQRERTASSIPHEHTWSTVAVAESVVWSSVRHTVISVCVAKAYVSPVCNRRPAPRPAPTAFEVPPVIPCPLVATPMRTAQGTSAARAIRPILPGLAIMDAPSSPLPARCSPTRVGSPPRSPIHKKPEKAFSLRCPLKILSKRSNPYDFRRLND